MLWSGESPTTTCRASHKISATYAQVALACFNAFSASVPPVPRKLSAGFCTAESDEFPHNLRTFSTRYAHVFDERLPRNLRRVFPQRFRSKSAANSRHGRREKWRKESGGRNRVEKGRGVHTFCGTWNNSKGNCEELGVPRCSRRRRRQISSPRLQAGEPVVARVKSPRSGRQCRPLRGLTFYVRERPPPEGGGWGSGAAYGGSKARG